MSTEPLNIRGRDPKPPSNSTSPVGTPDTRLLRGQAAQSTPYGTPPPNIPLRGARNGPPANASSPQLVAFDSQEAPHAGSSDNPDVPDITELPEEEKLKVLQRHLVSRDEREANSADPSGAATPALKVAGPSTPRSAEDSLRQVQREDTDPFPVPFSAEGGDIAHDIYRWHSKQQKLARLRSRSYAPPSTETHPAFEHIHEPGGFRRNYVLLRNEQENEEPRVLLNNFIDFLTLFGHFAGEDLDEDEVDEDVDEETAYDGPSSSDGRVGESGERSALLPKGSSLSRSRSRRRANSVGPHGTASVSEAVLLMLKGFVGTGILFLGKAFFNGGILFSSILFVIIAALSLYSFLLLVDTKFVVSGSFGDIGGQLIGPWMRQVILASIVISQIGFVAAYTIFVAENLQAFIWGVSHCVRYISVQYLILIQLIVFLPMCLIRDLAKLSTAALVADAFILAGLVYIFGSEISIIVERGIADVTLFNPRDFPLFVGTAVFSFEGVGLVIPITDAMKEPRKFPKVLTGVMIFLVFLFGGAGVLAYLTFGSDIQTVVLVNLNLESKMVQAVQFLYSLAILLSVPLQLFPAVRIMENGLFTKSGKSDPRVKWQKNFFRFTTVMGCTALSWAGASDLDKFVAFIGCFACVPLCFIYPAMLHYKACARTRSAKVKDIAMITFGAVVFVYTTVQTVRLMIDPSSPSNSGSGLIKCSPS